MLKAWIFFIQNTRFTYLLIIVITLAGLISLQAIPKESSPEVQVPVGIVTAILPGASTEVVESLITEVIEDEIDALSNVYRYSSTSRQGVSSIIVEFDSNADLDKSIQDLKDAVDSVTSSLPSETEDPFVSEIDFVNQPIIIASLSGNIPPESFVALADIVEDELRSIPGVSRVEISGLQKREIQVLIRAPKLEQHGLSIGEVVTSLTQANMTLPAGTAVIGGSEYAIVLDTDIETAQDVAQTPITTRGSSVVYVRDVADVIDGIQNASSKARVSINGESAETAVSLSVYKRSGEDITRITTLIKERIKELQEGGALEGIDLVTTYDAGQYVKDDLRNLSISGLQTVFLVFLVLFLALGIREALIASAAIPLSFLLTFFGLYISGNTINFISLFSLILAVGILVDTAIVVTEAIHTKLQEGVSKKQAAFNALKTYQKPLISGTLTTVAVFVPLFFLSGVTGEFIASIPFTIIFVLLASLFVALGLLPTVAVDFLKTAKDRFETTREAATQWIQKAYLNKLNAVIGNRKAENRFIGGIIALFFIALLLPVFGFVQVVFFPQGDVDFIYVDIEAKQGSTLEETDLVVRAVEEILYTIPDIDSFITTVGASSMFGEGRSDSDLANITINLKKGRSRSSLEILSDIQTQTNAITFATVRVNQPSEGPPVGDPIVIRLEGEDLSDLENAATRVEDILKEIPGTRDIVLPTRDNTTQFTFTVNKARAAQLRVNSLALAQSIRTALVGIEATSIRTSGDDIDVVVRLDTEGSVENPYATDNLTPDDIKRISIPTPQGNVLIGSVAEVSLESNRSVIRHTNGIRTVEVTSQLEPGATVPQVMTAFMSMRNSLELPESVNLVIGGESEETNKTFMEMFVALIAGLLLMLIVLLLEFNSYRYTAYVLAIVPFSLIGVLFGLALVGKSLSFPSLLGVIALAGIIVNNSIILIDRMNSLREESEDLAWIVKEAGISRLRPILLTTITTVIGVVPLTYASALWAPLAWSIIFGLTWSVVLTLILVPVLYYRWPGKKKEEPLG